MKNLSRKIGLFALAGTVLFISACGGGGSSSTNDSSTTTVTAPGTPGVPTLTSADSQLTASWTAVDGAASYRVYYNTADDSSSATGFSGDSDATDTGCYITGLTNGTTYYVWIVAVNDTGSSDYSASASGTPVADTTAPAKISLTGISATESSITFTWTDPSESDFDHAEVSVSGGSDSTSTTVTAGTETLTLTALDSGSVAADTKYTFSIKSVDETGNLSDALVFYVMTDSLGGTGITFITVSDTTDLAAMTGNDNYLLTEDIDMLSESWTPLALTGIFNGNGRTISNLGITTSGDTQGFFTTLSGSVSDLTLADISISGTNSYIGALAGANNGGTISNCSVTGTVDGASDIGGLVGYTDSSGTVSDSCSAAAVTGTGDNVGGLIGENNSGTVSDSCATGAVMGLSDIGGLVGYNHTGSEISNSYATGNVTGSGTNVGGLIGENYNSNTTFGCYATGAVEDTGSSNNVGGLAGYNYGSEITTCYATGSVTANSSDNVGGLAGYNRNSTVSNSYATTGTVSGVSSVGGLVGYNYSTSNISTCYATGTVTGTGNSIGGLVGYNYSTSDISTCYATGTVTGTGNNVGGLIGENDGNGMTNGNTISKSYAAGDVTGNGNNVGGLVGYNYNYATLSNCYTSGTVTGDSASGDYIGGLVGYNYNYSKVLKCYAIGNVTYVNASPSYAGALVGRSYYLGIGDDVLDSFYNSDNVSISDSYGTAKTTEEMKDIDTFTYEYDSGDSDSSAGLDNAWDFTGTKNDDADTDDTWAIDSSFNNGYPYLTGLQP